MDVLPLQVRENAALRRNFAFALCQIVSDFTFDHKITEVLLLRVRENAAYVRILALGLFHDSRLITRSQTCFRFR